MDNIYCWKSLNLWIFLFYLIIIKYNEDIYIDDTNDESLVSFVYTPQEIL
jgi:hypothetical protein